MEKTLQGHSEARGHTAGIPLARATGWGLMGGLAGTIVMDLFLIGAFPAAGLPSLMCFSIVGDTVARFFTILGDAVVHFFATLGIEIAGGVPLGNALNTNVDNPRRTLEGYKAAGVSSISNEELLTLYMDSQLLLPGHAEHVIGLAPLRHLFEFRGAMSDQAFASLVYGWYGGLIYFTPIVGGWVADRRLALSDAVIT